MGPEVQKGGKGGRPSASYALGSPQRARPILPPLTLHCRGARPSPPGPSWHLPGGGPHSAALGFSHPEAFPACLRVRTSPSRPLQPHPRPSRRAHTLARRAPSVLTSARRARLIEPLCLGFRAQIRGACAVRSLRVSSARGQTSLTGSTGRRARAGLDREGEVLGLFFLNVLWLCF